MAYQYIIYDKRDRVAYITINRPEVMNALNIPCHHELSDAWNDFRDDPDMWVAILTGYGDKAFSTGNDLKYMAEHAHEISRASFPAGGFGGITQSFQCWKPMIAAINGYAVGGGLEMALACDIIIAAEHARLGLPEAAMGRIPGAGGVHRLPRQIPLKIAMGMMLTARNISAQEAYRIGLVNEVVPSQELMSAAEKWAREIVRCSPLAIRSIKEAAYEGLNVPVQEAVGTTYPLQAKLMKSEDFKEGPRAFAEKRAPEWKGI